MSISDRFKSFTPDSLPQLGNLNLFLQTQFAKLSDTLRTTQAVLQALDTTKTLLGNYANDTLAAAAGVPKGGLYRNGNAVQVRVT